MALMLLFLTKHIHDADKYYIDPSRFGITDWVSNKAPQSTASTPALGESCYLLYPSYLLEQVSRKSRQSRLVSKGKSTS